MDRSEVEQSSAQEQTEWGKMGTQPRDESEEHASGETPEDVAILYSWANLQGAKYRDFSATRRENRAQIRYRAAEQLRLAALNAQAEAEAAASKADAEAAAASAEAERAAARLVRGRDPRTSVMGNTARQDDAEQMRESSLRAAAHQTRRAAAERDEAARRAEAAALANSIARREELEIADARASGVRQAAQYRESGLRSRQMRSVDLDVPGRISDPYLPQAIAEGEYFELPGTPSADLGPDRFRQQRQYIERGTGTELGPSRASVHDSELRQAPGQRISAEDLNDSRVSTASAPEEMPRPTAPGSPPRVVIDSVAEELSIYADQHHRPYRGYDADWDRRPAADLSLGRDQAIERDSSHISQSGIPSTPYSEYQKVVGSSVPAPVEVVSRIPDARGETVLNPVDGTVPVEAAPSASMEFQAAAPLVKSVEANSAVQRFSEVGPAWLYPRQAPVRTPDPSETRPQTPGQSRLGSNLENTLHQSRERVAARWFALKGAFANAVPEQTSAEPRVGDRSGHVPIVVVFSIAGGVGKTSLVATLGRALSSFGEKVLLADTTSHGLLPFYFGASELHPGVVRTFLPPSGSADASIQLVNYDVDPGGDAARSTAITDLLGFSQGMNRVLIDLNGNNGWLVEKLARMKPTILVPLAADMNSVISLPTIERCFTGMLDDRGNSFGPYYLLSQFDTSLPLHLDVREVLRQKLGERLLPFVIRRAAGVSEALAEGMTIIDYDPQSPVAQDYLGVASWVRSVSAPATAGLRNLRWSER